ncbi:type II secretion system protein [Arcobacter sp. LA11]|uniref:type II secretion system protein n=1 Tax=Arcobacter sp. LA11 TaxID=1898176 RepID=UPI000934A6AD|nr:type II secretion system protein [Arcobacter sp. LA11]
MKKSFTLIELVIVILLISIVSYLVFSSFNIKKEKEYKVSLENVKEFMLKKFSYENTLSLVCIEEETKDCYIFIDENINKDIKIKNLFTQIPEVYNYNKDLNSYDFTKIRLDDIEYEPFFELKINSDKKHKDIIVDTLDERVYLFSSILKNAKVFENTNEIVDKFSENEIEVKDAL